MLICVEHEKRFITSGPGHVVESYIFINSYLHFHCESVNEPLHLRCGSYLYKDQMENVLAKLLHGEQLLM